MSEGASGAPDAAVRLSMKRSSDSSRSESETKRHHTDHSTRDVVMLLDDFDVGRAVERCREVCCRSETFLVDAFRDKLRACGSLQRKTIGKCVRQHKRGILGAAGHCEEFDPVLVHRAKMEEKDFVVKMGVFDVVPRSAAADKECHVIRTRWVTVNKGSDDAPQLRAGWVVQEFRGVVAVTNTSTSRRHLTWR